MQTSSVQSMPCATEDLARANATSMMTQVANEKGGVKLINIDVKEVSGMFIAVAVYEIPDAELKEKDDTKKGEDDSKSSGNPDEEMEDDVLLYAAAHGGLKPDLKNGELLPDQMDPKNFSPQDPDVGIRDTRNDSYSDGTAPIIKQAVLVSPTVPPPDATLVDAETLEKLVKTDFNEPSPGNIPVNPDMLPPNLAPEEQAAPEPAQ